MPCCQWHPGRKLDHLEGAVPGQVRRPNVFAAEWGGSCPALDHSCVDGM